jgi:hypothetical protein
MLFYIDFSCFRARFGRLHTDFGRFTTCISRMQMVFSRFETHFGRLHIALVVSGRFLVVWLLVVAQQFYQLLKVMLLL